MTYVSPNASAFWRFLFGVITLLIISYSALPSLKKIKANWQGVFLVGCIGLFGFIFFFFQGLKYTSEMNGALIISLNPATTLVLAILFQKHKASKQQVGGMILAFIGVVYLLLKGDFSAIENIRFNKGDIFFLIANVLFALQHIWTKKYAAQLGNLSFTTLTNICCFLGFTVLLLLETPIQLKGLGLDFWASAMVMGVFGTALAYFFWNYGISKIGAAKGAVFLNAIPLFTALFAIFFGADLFAYHLVSIILITSGLLLVQLERIRSS